jgi:hypothetical protein
MIDSPETTDTKYDVLRRLRSARRDFHSALMRDAQARERVFAPVHLLRTLGTHVERIADGTPRERCGRLFVLTVLLYGALDWQFAGYGIDIEADVQLERIRQNHRHGGTSADDLLSADDWRIRLRRQLLRLEQQLPDEELYAHRLVKLTALAQAALEAVTRQLEG